MIGRKIGITSVRDGDEVLVERFLNGLEDGKVDFTNGFRGLVDGVVPGGMTDWENDWRLRLMRETGDTAAVMRAANPAFIARNHRIEAMIQAAVAGDYAPFTKLNEILANPFDDQPENAAFRLPPESDEVVTATFCGT